MRQHLVATKKITVDWLVQDHFFSQHEFDEEGTLRGFTGPAAGGPQTVGWESDLECWRVGWQ
jgi:hypothetical protein